MVTMDKYYLRKLEFDDLQQFICEMNKEPYFSNYEVVRIYLDITSKTAYMVRIEGTRNLWMWSSDDYYDDGPYFIYRDSLESILNKLACYE